MTKCPAHDDHSPSLSVAEGDDGCVLLNCHAGCAVEDMVAEIGLEMRDSFDDDGTTTRAGDRMRFTSEKKPEPEVEDLGAPTAKQIAALIASRRIRHPRDLDALAARRLRVWEREWLGFPTVGGGWKLVAVDAQGTPRLDEGGTLIRRNIGKVSLVVSSAVRMAFETGHAILHRAFDVEGESDMLSLIACMPDAVALTGTGGAGSLAGHDRHRDQLAALALAEVVIVRDLDNAGRTGAAKAAAWWHGLDVTVRILALPAALGDKGDLRDYLLGRPAMNAKTAVEPLGSAADLEELAAAAPAWSPSKPAADDPQSRGSRRARSIRRFHGSRAR
ncbi:MAG: toprim domain-containing protein [Deltaproteobacteria bacterium]|nr:toprim domain-containing protein [Deltaproteobacteria bacterium]